jgi:hypothetical protein
MMSFIEGLAARGQSVRAAAMPRRGSGAVASFKGTLQESLKTAASPAATKATAVSSATTSATPVSDLGTDSVAAVKQACVDAGMNVSNLKFAFNDNLIYNPLGNYRYPQVIVTLPDGELFKCAAVDSLRNPQLAAHELRQRLSESPPRGPGYEPPVLA